MLSIILPFYKRLAEFAIALANNARFFEGHEVVLVIDEPSQASAVLCLIHSYKKIKWIVLLNEVDHEWRNPAPVINVGIRHATRPYVLVMSPETICINDATRLLLEASWHPDTCHFSVSHIGFCTYDEMAADPLIFDRVQKWQCGSVCFPRNITERIGGYNEFLSLWGGDDYDWVRRMEIAGLHKNYVGECRLLHPSFIAMGTRNPIVDVQMVSNPLPPPSAEWGWGKAFEKIIYTNV